MGTANTKCQGTHERVYITDWLNQIDSVGSVNYHNHLIDEDEEWISEGKAVPKQGEVVNAQ